MARDSGKRLGLYEILAPIGAGGMGEVYKAKDTRLDRIVAIKVLPEHLAESPERKQRFEREAKAISQLNHPRICTLFDVGSEDGIEYLVMEFLEGETLAERLKKGPLPLDQALEYGAQIADGLDKAHRAGIVHRDLKPGNVMIRDGIKLLDFGLAKIVDEHGSAEGSDAPTRQKGLTGDHAILGTLQYMAPEQLEGKSVDARADVFAFGAVLYEMLTGVKAFEGESQASLIAAVLKNEPRPPSSVATRVPMVLDRFVQKCLAKSRDDRWQTARDVTTELEWIRTHREAPENKTAVASKGRPWSRWLVPAAFVAGVLVTAWMGRRNDEVSPSVTRVVITLPHGQELVDDPIAGVPLALSPDGRTLVYVAKSTEAEGAARSLYLRPLDSFESTAIAGTEGGSFPFFSPDGEWIGFFTGRELKKVALSGGAPSSLSPVESFVGGASWGRDGTIVYSTGVGRRSAHLMRVSQNGGEAERLFSAVAVSGVLQPRILPDGVSVLFGHGAVESIRTWVYDLAGGSARELDAGGLGVALYVPTGHLLRAPWGAAVEAVAFDARRRVSRGNPVPILHDVMRARGRSVPFLAVSEAGTLAYVVGERPEAHLVRVDRKGNADQLANDSSHGPRISPDGNLVAYNVQTATARGIRVYDIARGSSTHVTVEHDATLVAWKPSGDLLVYGGLNGLFLVPADGSRSEEPLRASELMNLPESWSPDGGYIAFTQIDTETTGLDIWIQPLSGEAFPFLVTPAGESAAQFSPDGRYIAYQSDESGVNEIYVRPFPEGDARFKISSAGGMAPVWSRTGDELFYRERTALMVVDVALGDDFAASRPRELFDGDFVVENTGHPYYDVAPDGQSFVMSQTPRDEPLTEIQVVLNWFDERVQVPIVRKERFICRSSI